MKYFVSVAGNIGVGKSSLVELLGKHYHWKAFYEPVGENPYLEDFYSDMSTWAFQSQIFFLTHRLQMHLELLDTPDSVVQDRSIYEDSEIFATNLFNQGYINQRDYSSYRKLYNVLVNLLRPPDLIVYLKASTSTLVSRIASRGRDYETGIKPTYLSQLNTLYDEWVNGFDLCSILSINTDNMDFVSNQSDFDEIAERIKANLGFT